MGTQTVFIDNANEQHNMILLKHFTEKNHAVVVDVKTRKRKTGLFSLLLTALLICRNKHGINHLCAFCLYSEGLPTDPVPGFHRSQSPGADGGSGILEGTALPLPEQFHRHH